MSPISSSMAAPSDFSFAARELVNLGAPQRTEFFSRLPRSTSFLPTQSATAQAAALSSSREAASSSAAGSSSAVRGSRKKRSNDVVFIHRYPGLTEGEEDAGVETEEAAWGSDCDGESADEPTVGVLKVPGEDEDREDCNSDSNTQEDGTKENQVDRWEAFQSKLHSSSWWWAWEGSGPVAWLQPLARAPSIQRLDLKSLIDPVPLCSLVRLCQLFVPSFPSTAHVLISLHSCPLTPNTSIQECELLFHMGTRFRLSNRTYDFLGLHSAFSDLWAINSRSVDDISEFEVVVSCSSPPLLQPCSALLLFESSLLTASNVACASLHSTLFHAGL